MAITPFLAMTASEMRNCAQLPPKIAWMACHFSPYGKGLSNFPKSLPPDSLLIIDDITPIYSHDPEVITQQLIQCLDTFSLSGVLLDFQRPENPEAAELTQYLIESLPCPVIVSEPYAPSGTVLLPPLPLTQSLETYLSTRQNQEVWLDLGCWGETLVLDETGCQNTALPPWEFPAEGFAEERLHCHYQIHNKENSVEFTLWRTKDDFSSLLEEAEGLGIHNAAGLYQEFLLL